MADSLDGREHTDERMDSPCSKKGTSLEEIKRRGRQLRSAHNDGNLLGLYGGLTPEDFNKQPQEVGLIYDERMLGHSCSWDNQFPEKPERLSCSFKRCIDYGLVDRCKRLEARFATKSEVLIGHSNEYFSTLERSADMSEDELKDLSSRYDGVFFDKTTYECSRLALGSSIELVDQICDGKVRNGMALVRPPGHHAMYDEACGYCFFNNVAIAAKHALDNHDLQRVLIIDWDVHHGQGTQYAFYNDPRVIYFSIHRYEHGDFWPNLRQSQYDQIGEGYGTGYNINVPLNKTQMTNGDYMAIFTQILLPVAYEFNPQLIIVSAGYDSAIGCPEGENLVTPALFAHFVTLLRPLAKGKLALILEGGYCLKSLAESVALSLRALLGDPCPNIFPLEIPCESIVASILHVLQNLRSFWRSLVFQGISEEEPEIWTRHKTEKEISFATDENRPDKYEIYGDYICHTPEEQKAMNIEVDSVIANTALHAAPSKTCLVYDEAMRKHRCTSVGAHPERPDRIRAIYDKHLECGFLERCKEIKSRTATDEEILLVHTQHQIDQVKSFRNIPLEDLHDMERSFNSVYLSQEAYECASLAVGCMLQVVDEVCGGRSQNGVAIVRPPGHHAEPDFSCGFCYFNTAAVAAKYAQKKYRMKRVLILDWDVHHGNGTQHMFWTDPSVLYVSLHRFDNGFFFPGGEDGNYDKVGANRGKGYNVNIPWNSKCGDAEYIAAFQQIVLPIAYEYGPELVIVSAGFDAAKGDPLGGFKITPEGYAHMTSMLTTLAGGKVIMLLEGGYNLHSISESMVMCTSMLLGDNCPVLPVSSFVPTEGAVETICDVLHTQKEYWKSLQFAVDLPLTPQQKEDMLAVHAAMTPREGMARITKGIDALAMTPLPDAGQVYGSDTSSSSEGSPIPKPNFQELDEKCTTATVRKMEPEPKGADNPDAVSLQNGNTEDQTAGKEATQSDGKVKVECAGTVDTEAKNDGTTDGNDEGLAEGACGGAEAGSSSADKVEMFAVVPLPWCRHMEEGIAPLPPRGLEAQDPCAECQHKGECWVCLRCYEVHCGRYINEHMLFHGLETEHPLVLSYADLSVWCYPCESYVHHADMLPAKRAAHVSKFGYEPSGF